MPIWKPWMQPFLPPATVFNCSLGGHGFMTDHPVEKWMREARAISLLWGGVDCARRDAVEGAE